MLQSSIISQILEFIYRTVTIFSFDHMTDENREFIHENRSTRWIPPAVAVRMRKFCPVQELIRLQDLLNKFRSRAEKTIKACYSSIIHIHSQREIEVLFSTLKNSPLLLAQSIKLHLRALVLIPCHRCGKSARESRNSRHLITQHDNMHANPRHMRGSRLGGADICRQGGAILHRKNDGDWYINP